MTGAHIPDVAMAENLIDYAMAYAAAKYAGTAAAHTVLFACSVFLDGAVQSIVVNVAFQYPPKKIVETCDNVVIVP